MKIKTVIVLSLILISTSIFAQSSKWSFETGAGIGYYANIGVWGLRYNNAIDYNINERFSISGGLGHYGSLLDFQTENGVNNTLSLMSFDGSLNLCLFKIKQTNSVWYSLGLSYFKGVEFLENSYSVATRIEGTNINSMGFNMKLKYKHRLSDKLTGSLNLETYSINSFFDPNQLLVNIGYSVSYNF